MQDAFQQLGTRPFRRSFADARTYLYQRQGRDQQVHIGFDLAVTAMWV